MKSRDPVRRHGRRVLVSLVVTLGALVISGAGLAAPPANDELVNATAITGLPYTDSTNTSEATWSSGEGGCAVSGHTIWYSLTLDHDATVRINLATTGFLGSLTLWHSGTPPAASPVCADIGGQLTYRAKANEKYYLQIASRFSWEPGGPVTLSIAEVPPPSNDAFSEATELSALPFSESGDMTAATIEPGEPQASPYYPPPASVWYRFTPSASGSVTAGGSGVLIAAYSGIELDELTLIDAREMGYGTPLTIHVDAGEPVYFQLVPGFGGVGGLYGPFELSVYETPPPDVNFGVSIYDPSIFDPVTFFSFVGDPVGIGVDRYDWSFGDGSTSTEPNPSHRYTRDGSYEVTLTGTTIDGRSASRTYPLEVRTHDISILWFTTPGKARVGRTYTIMVGVGNTRYAEPDVQVVLSKSTPSGFQQIGASSKPVPRMAPKKTTVYSFTYTFTEDDLVAGKVTFQAQTFMAFRDALQGDNVATSGATQVTR
jgi:hypothetical protein